MYRAFWASIVLLLQALVFFSTSSATPAHASDRAPAPAGLASFAVDDATDDDSVAEVQAHDAAYGHFRQNKDEQAERLLASFAPGAAPRKFSFHFLPNNAPASYAGDRFLVGRGSEPKQVRAPPRS